MKKETRELICNLADKAADAFEKECDEHIKKLDKLMKECEQKCNTKEEAIDVLYNSGLWLNSKENLVKCFE